MMPAPFDRLTANPPPEHHELGQAKGDICNRYPEPNEDQPRGYKPKPCNGEMVYFFSFDDRLVACDTCGETT